MSRTKAAATAETSEELGKVERSTETASVTRGRKVVDATEDLRCQRKNDLNRTSFNLCKLFKIII